MLMDVIAPAVSLASHARTSPPLAQGKSAGNAPQVTSAMEKIAYRISLWKMKHTHSFMERVDMTNGLNGVNMDKGLN